MARHEPRRWGVVDFWRKIMTLSLRAISVAALLLAVAATPGFAQDAMATDAMATDAMATDAMAGDAMATDAMAGDMMAMSDDELALCLEQAGAITFPAVMEAATAACHGVHNGMDVMGAIEQLGMDAMSGDAMASDAMAPAQ
jgi:pentapeptide MXKDX repeat protein